MDHILLPGRRKDLKYMALRVCLEVVDKIEVTPQAFKQKDKELIGRNILERYRDFLRLEKDPAVQAVLDRTNLALKSSTLDYDEAKEIVYEFPDSEAELELQREAGISKRDSWLYRSGLEGPSPEEAVAAETPEGGVL